ncbi:MAG TPA: type II CAAX endopeptidase family protein, partial [Phenylobacterium sp.]
MNLSWHPPEPGRAGVLQDGRFLWLRALGWMVLVGVLIMGLYLVPISIALGGGRGGPLRLLLVIALSVLVSAAYAGLVRLGERRWPSELSLRPAALEILAGIVLGGALMSAIVAVLVQTGAYQYVGASHEPPWSALQMSVASGLVEEVIARALMLRLLMRAFGAGWALAISSAIFGLLHLPNQDASLFAAVAIALEAGVFLGALYLLTGRIWVSVGAHAAWNFFQGYVYGTDVSGTGLDDTLYSFAPNEGASALMSGGAFGPEASLPALV